VASKKAPADRDQDEDIVHAPWRHGEPREQGSRTGRCGWITSFLRSTQRPSSRGSPGARPAHRPGRSQSRSLATRSDRSPVRLVPPRTGRGTAAPGATRPRTLLSFEGTSERACTSP
jgi:hypothetical protein